MPLLASIYALIGADLSQLDRQFAMAVKRGSRAGADTGREFQSSLKRAMSSGAAFGTGGMAATMGLDGVGSLLDSLKQKFAAIGQVGGVDYAAQIQRQSVAYTKLFGSASKARDVIKQIQKDSIETGTSSLDNLALLRKFTALPVDPMERTKIARTAADTSAAYGFTGAERNRLADNIGDIFGNGFDRAQSNQFQMLGINVEKTLGLGLGKTFKNEQDALSSVKGMSATDQGNAFMRGLEKQFGGMGKSVAEGTLLGRLGQLQETFTQMGESSGNLALKGLTPLAGGLVGLASALKTVNEATGGGAGLIAMLVMGGAALFQTVRTGMMAWSVLKLLNAELKRMAANAAVTNMAAGQGGGGLAGAVGGVGGAAAAGGKVGFMGRIAQRFPGLAGIGSKIGGVAGKANIAGLVLAGAQIGLSAYASNLKDEKKKSRLSSIADESGKFGLYGAIAGALIGSIIPGAGTLAGAGIGGLIGGIGGGVYGGFKSTKANPAADLSQAAKDLSGAAGKIGSLSAIGGNSRINSALQTLESAYALQGAF